MGSKIKVANICRGTSEEDVKAVLKTAGTAVSVKFDHVDMRLGMISATVEMDCDASANNAVSWLNGTAFRNYPMHICFAEQGASRGGGSLGRHGAHAYGR